jgi:peptidoglycan/xylan/chitin deacetylase (PgdA/CDA1 family)
MPATLWKSLLHRAGRTATNLVAPVPTGGFLPGDPLARLGIPADQLADTEGKVAYRGKARYLNAAKSVVTHSVDDTTEALPGCLDAMDRHGIKATVFISTKSGPLLARLWPRLRQAIADGHEIGSHSRRHPCRVPDSFLFCLGQLTSDEIEGSRDDILENTGQPHVWSWAYPCGNCADRKFIQRKIARAGYLLGRAYPDELQGRHAVPDLQSFDPNPYAARYTQVVQNGYAKRLRDGRNVAVSGRNDLAAINAKFDEVSTSGGVYSFLSHPQMLEFGEDRFYERHLAHIAGRHDVWYLPMGPLYAYRILSERTLVRRLSSTGPATKFAVFNSLDPRIYNGSITLEFRAEAGTTVIAGGRELPEHPAGPVTGWTGEYVRRSGQNLLVTVRPNAVLEFR